MKTNFLLLCFWAVALLSALPVLAQPDTVSDSSHNIFSRLQGFDPLHVVIETDYKNLRKNRKETNWQPAVFKIMVGDSLAFEQTVQITTRGNMRKKTCDFPPVKIRFFNEKPLDDSLADINELKLVASCRSSEEDEQLVRRENLAYELYNLLTDESFRVKPAEVKFISTGRKNATLDGVAFFIESEQEMAARLGGRPLKPTVISPKIMDSVAYTRMCLFQYMIGNTDWGSYTRHNIKVVGFPDRWPIAVPYDFDYAGLVNADYAIPPPDLYLRNVRERCYLGLCHSTEFFQAEFDTFLSKKEKILALCEKYSGLSYSSRQDCLYYLREFFSILENPEKAQKEIVERCNRRIVKK